MRNTDLIEQKFNFYVLSITFLINRLFKQIHLKQREKENKAGRYVTIPPNTGMNSPVRNASIERASPGAHCNVNRFKLPKTMSIIHGDRRMFYIYPTRSSRVVRFGCGSAVQTTVDTVTQTTH